MCLKVIGPRIISCIVTDLFSWFWSFFSIFSSLFFQPFFFCFYLHLPIFCRVISKHFSHLPFNIGILFLSLKQSSILHTLWNCVFFSFFFSMCPLVWRVILGHGSERKIIRLKVGSKWIIFYTSERIAKYGRLSFQTQSPNWRVIP